MGEEMQKGRVFTGARARFMINGVKVGYARNVTVSEEIRYDPVEVLDNIEVLEFAPISYMVRLRASQFRIVGETLKSRGWFPNAGANAEEHLSNILMGDDPKNVLTAIVEDSKTQNILATIEQIKIASHNWTVDARGVVGEDVEFVGIRMKDESEVSAPPTP